VPPACQVASSGRRAHGAGMSKPGVAGVLSFVIPGVGQLYNGAFWRAIFWLVITPGFYVGSGGWLGWICHLASAYTAYRYAQRALGQG
jgi:hypothetical protein